MLSKTSEYAIRALTYLSRGENHEAILGRELSEMSGIPSNYLAKILVMLRRAGFLEATRGPGGGYRLKLPADHIRLIDVVKTFEGESVIPVCILKQHRLCSDDNPCTAHHAWGKVKVAYLEFLENTTVEAIAGQGLGPS